MGKIKFAIKETNEFMLGMSISAIITIIIVVLIFVLVIVPLYGIGYLVYYNSGWYALLILPFIYFTAFLSRLVLG